MLYYVCVVLDSQNKVSDSPAQFACLEDITMTWLGSEPSEALEFAMIDCMDLVIE